MDPAILNYLQQMQGQQQPQGTAPAQQEQYNPFDAGISRAISSARESLGMTEKQQDKAVRQTLLSFASNLGQQPAQRGFLNNLGSIGQALAPALSEYNNAEDNAIMQNNALANQILSYRNAEGANQAREEEKLWKRELQERKLNETRRHHDMMNSRYQNNDPMNQESSASLFPTDKFSPFESKAEITAASKDKKALGGALNELQELEKEYTKFRKKYGDQALDPMSAYRNVTNPGKDFFGNFFNIKKLREETAARKTLGSRINKFVTGSERALKGGGVIGPRLIELFKSQGIYPDLEKDTPETFIEKKDMLLSELQNAYKAADLGLRYKVRLDPSNIKEFEGYINPSKDLGIPENESSMPSEASINSSTVEMQDSSGSRFAIPANEVPNALNDGLIPVQP